MGFKVNLLAVVGYKLTSSSGTFLQGGYVSRNKPDMTRKDLEMTGLVKAVTKKLEPEDLFKILVVYY